MRVQAMAYNFGVNSTNENIDEFFSIRFFFTRTVFSFTTKTKSKWVFFCILIIFIHKQWKQQKLSSFQNAPAPETFTVWERNQCGMCERNIKEMQSLPKKTTTTKEIFERNFWTWNRSTIPVEWTRKGSKQTISDIERPNLSRCGRSESDIKLYASK